MPPSLRLFGSSISLSLIEAAAIYALAYGVGLAAFAWMAWRRGLDTAGVRAVAVAGLLGGLVGANLAQWVAGGTAGKTILGGIAGGYLIVIWYKRRLGLRRPLGDLFAVALSAGEAVGRWGCFVGGCCYGRTVNSGTLPWAVYQHDSWRHPSQLYLSLACFAILGILLWLDRKGTLPENGLFYTQSVLYACARFVVEFWRDGKPFALGLTLAQWVCLAAVFFFGYKLARRTARTERPAPVSEKAAYGSLS